MILHGDELGRTQGGNNNTYAQDSDVSWIDWDTPDGPLIEFVAAVVQLRRQHPTFRRARFFDGRPVRREEGAPVPDIEWYRPDGNAMAPEDWDAGFGKAIAVFLNGDGIHERDRRGQPISDRSFLLLFNAADDTVDFTLPGDDLAVRWETLIDTAGSVADPSDLTRGRRDHPDHRTRRRRAPRPRRARAGPGPLRGRLARGRR